MPLNAIVAALAVPALLAFAALKRPFVPNEPVQVPPVPRPDGEPLIAAPDVTIPVGAPGVGNTQAPDAVVQISILTDFTAVEAAVVKLNVYVVLVAPGAELESVTLRAVICAALTCETGRLANTNTKIAIPETARPIYFLARTRYSTFILRASTPRCYILTVA